MTTGLAFEVLAPGPLTTVQDLGRPGLAHLGVPTSGALDLPAMALANRAVGNPIGAAVLETTLSGPRLRLIEGAPGTAGPGLDEVGVWVAITGAAVEAKVDGRPVGAGRRCWLPLGSTLRIGAARDGARSYLAVRGGVGVDPVLGSRSTDLLSGLGPPPLAAGQRLPIGLGEHPLPADPTIGIPASPEPFLTIRPGPRHERFDPSALDVLTSTAWQVSPASNRIGVRLSGPPLERVRHAGLPSEAVVTGSLQIPPDGQPVLFLADHPTTGGYPVIAVVDDEFLPWAGQARPGGTLRFRLA